MENTEIMRRVIHQEVVKALVNSRLDYDHPIGSVLESEARSSARPLACAWSTIVETGSCSKTASSN
jgi:ubiquinone biosynthesis protein COQ9